ncbi:unnamed protein product [Chrysoparadoxa australica]
MSQSGRDTLAYMFFGSLAATAVTCMVLYTVHRPRRRGNRPGALEIFHDRNDEDGLGGIPHHNSTASLNQLHSFFHPEGPNIGPSSSDTWFQKDREMSPKTDLLHKGHSKGGKLVLVLVGLPGCGKTYIARKVARYLRWIHYHTRAFSLARYRIERCGGRLPATFFDNTNMANVKMRLDLVAQAVEDMMTYLNRGGECAILDGTNFNRERRDLIAKRVAQEDGYEIMWLESLCKDETITKRRIAQLKESSPDFLDEEDFLARVEHYKNDYQSVDTDEGSYAKLHDAGKAIEVHAAQGFVPTKITSFLMNLHIDVRPVYITRHGESLFNVKGWLGGDPDLSPKGYEYADALAEFVAGCPDLDQSNLCVWSSTMKRARQTSKSIKCKRYVEWRALREIEVGVCDGMSYEDVKKKFPEEFAAREKDKLNYRYGRGESYLDIISRLEPVIFEMERQKAPLLIVAHQAVLRCLYAYFLDLPSEEIPYLSIPLHTVIKLTPQAFGCSESRKELIR